MAAKLAGKRDTAANRACKRNVSKAFADLTCHNNAYQAHFKHCQGCCEAHWRIESTEVGALCPIKPKSSLTLVAWTADHTGIKSRPKAPLHCYRCQLCDVEQIFLHQEGSEKQLFEQDCLPSLQASAVPDMSRYAHLRRCGGIFQVACCLVGTYCR